MSEVIEQEVASLPVEQYKISEQSVLEQIGGMATNPDVNHAVVDSLLGYAKYLKQDAKEVAYARAFFEVKSMLPMIEKGGKITFKDKNGLERISPFARLEDIEPALRPLLNENGLFDSYSSEYLPNVGTIGIVIITHRDGHSKEYKTLPLPLDTSGSKNNLQAGGSTMSYIQRYALKAAFGIVTKGEDNDGAGDLSPINKEQLQKLNDLIDECVQKTGEERAGMIKRMNTHFEVDSLHCLHAKNFDNAVSILNLKISLASQPKKEAI